MRLGPTVLPSSALSTGRHASVGGDQQLVVVQHPLDRVVDLRAGLLVAGEVQRAQPVAFLHPAQVLGWEVLPMVGEQVHPAVM